MTDLSVEQRRAAASHAVALAQPMVGAPMCGDPVIVERQSFDALLVRRACQYAAALLGRDPQWSGDLSHLQAVFQAPATVLFCASLGRDPVVVATVRLPQHVLDFNPDALPLRLSG